MTDENQNSKKAQEKKPVRLLDHDYDGIRELDNPLPNWWLQTFYWAVVFSIFYVTYYELGGGPDQWTELNHDMVPIRQALATAKAQGFSDDDVLSRVGVAAPMRNGKKIFSEKCATCHGAQGQGMIGPNLTDHAWINGNAKPGSIAKVISEGVPAKGMPGWGPLMSREDLISVAAYVVSIKDSDPPHPKAPQGELQP